MTITADQTRRELEVLIREFPDRIGSIPDADDRTCVYFLDEKGEPVKEDYDWEDEPPKLVTPICIVAQWIQTFHPELKESMFEVLSRNNTIQSLLSSNNSSLPDEVLMVLRDAQNHQDTGRTWGQIDLDNLEG